MAGEPQDRAPEADELQRLEKELLKAERVLGHKRVEVARLRAGIETAREAGARGLSWRDHVRRAVLAIASAVALSVALHVVTSLFRLRF